MRTKACERKAGPSCSEGPQPNPVFEVWPHTPASPGTTDGPETSVTSRASKTPPWAGHEDTRGCHKSSGSCIVILPPKRESAPTCLFARARDFSPQVVRFNDGALHSEKGIVSEGGNESPSGATSLAFGQDYLARLHFSLSLQAGQAADWRRFLVFFDSSFLAKEYIHFEKQSHFKNRS